MCATFTCENCGRLGCVVHHRCESIERAGCDLRDEPYELNRDEPYELNRDDQPSFAGDE